MSRSYLWRVESVRGECNRAQQGCKAHRRARLRRARLDAPTEATWARMASDPINILFVCSGNTCRSPMAAAITRHFAKSRPESKPAIQVESAGVGAMDGLPSTPEAGAALKSLGIDPGEHRSQSLTRELVERADVIYCMTASHAAGVRAIAPNSDGKVHLLDPEGQDVLDPIGGSQRVYDEASRLLADLIATRLKELDQ